MSEKLQTTTLEFSSPATGGLIYTLKATKDRDFVPKVVRVKFVGEDFWKTLSRIGGSAAVGTFRKLLHPVTLTPDYFVSKDVFTGKSEISIVLEFGISGKFKMKRTTVIKKLRAFIDDGDPAFAMEFEYGEKGLKFKQIGLLCSVKLTASDILYCVENDRPIFASGKDSEGCTLFDKSEKKRKDTEKSSTADKRPAVHDVSSKTSKSKKSKRKKKKKKNASEDEMMEDAPDNMEMVALEDPDALTVKNDSTTRLEEIIEPAHTISEDSPRGCFAFLRTIKRYFIFGCCTRSAVEEDQIELSKLPEGS